MDAALGALIGLGLAAACGFRVFVPFLVASVAARSGHLELAGGFEWISSSPALVAFAVATLLEVAAYYVPWVDNLLDAVTTPAAVVAGILVSASAAAGLDPFLKWTLAVIAGGGLAAGVQLLTAGVRQASLVATGGLGNPLVSTAEAAGSVAVAALAILAPLLALALVAALALWAASRLRGRRRTA